MCQFFPSDMGKYDNLLGEDESGREIKTIYQKKGILIWCFIVMVIFVLFLSRRIYDHFKYDKPLPQDTGVLIPRGRGSEMGRGRFISCIHLPDNLVFTYIDSERQPLIKDSTMTSSTDYSQYML